MQQAFEHLHVNSESVDSNNEEFDFNDDQSGIIFSISFLEHTKTYLFPLS